LLKTLKFMRGSKREKARGNEHPRAFSFIYRAFLRDQAGGEIIDGGQEINENG